ncbi:disulfide bond formation protein B [Altererythrobacter sp. KTW20L]|uniref:disulfide bond formation protein B n=1 Tax=Altererythrobacter sp. KTW20L TaxID=2942210 RepID=UPI0020C0BCFD|nr:disulfide bond formation protein B [Altererythrobacter sp. KTW20L]MCL6249909.1 disulfide bond formation protein B [Altererythrobacter sp. KTW20L]
MMRKGEFHAQRLALAIPALLLAGAYVSQYGFGLYPCEMCWWQRWPHFAALVFAIAAYAMPPQRRPLVGLAAVAILVSGLIGVFHAGVEYDWWEGITACALAPTTGGDALEAILAQPTISCDIPAWTLMGISLAGFNAIFSIGGAITIFALLRKKTRR